MFYYKIYGMTVESDIELQEAYGYVTDGTPQIRIHYSDMGEILKEIESVIADKPIKGYVSATNVCQYAMENFKCSLIFSRQ